MTDYSDEDVILRKLKEGEIISPAKRLIGEEIAKRIKEGTVTFDMFDGEIREDE